MAVFADLKPMQVFRVLPGDGRWYLRTAEPVRNEPGANTLMDLETGALGWLHSFNPVHDVWESAESFFTLNRLFPVDSDEET